MESRYVCFVTASSGLLVMFAQNLIFFSSVNEYIKCNFIKEVLTGNIITVLLLAVDLIVVYLIILRGVFKKRNNSGIIISIVFLICVFLYILQGIFSATLPLFIDISNKRNYEIIDGNQVIVDVYDGRFLVMNCKIEDGNLFIEKGKYSFVEMERNDIRYLKFENVNVDFDIE